LEQKKSGFAIAMNKNMYDTDITTWSPHGRLYQLEYAMEAVKQGSATVGAKSKSVVVLAALKRSPTAELSSYQEKMFRLDPHLGMSVSGLISDGRVLARFIRDECMQYRYLYGSSHPVSRIASKIGEKAQRHTQSSSKRPFGVGLLLAGLDSTGPHLYQSMPNGEVYDFKAIAIGARSQSARTYLERHFTTFPDMGEKELVTHVLKALATTCPEGVTLTQQNTTIAIVGVGKDFTMYTDASAAPYLAEGITLAPGERPSIDEGEGDEAPADAGRGPMDEN